MGMAVSGGARLGIGSGPSGFNPIPMRAIRSRCRVAIRVIATTPATIIPIATRPPAIEKSTTKIVASLGPRPCDCIGLLRWQSLLGTADQKKRSGRLCFFQGIHSRNSRRFMSGFQEHLKGANGIAAELALNRHLPPRNTSHEMTSLASLRSASPRRRFVRFRGWP